MAEDWQARTLSSWADGLAAAARDQLSTYDLCALYDTAVRGVRNGELRREILRWLGELGPATRNQLSAYDVEALLVAFGSGDVRLEGPRVDPTGLGPPSHPEQARAGGFTGDACPACGSVAVIRSGACLTCRDCGATSGCA